MQYSCRISSKIDLDTVMAVWLLKDIIDRSNTKFVKQATVNDLISSDIICIECGGSGQIDKMNFDHHNYGEISTTESRCATKQAYDFIELFNNYALNGIHRHPFTIMNSHIETINKLVEYIQILDVRGPHILRSFNSSKGPYITDVFGGVKTHFNNHNDRLNESLRIIELIVKNDIDPFSNINRLLNIDNTLLKYIKSKHENKMKSIENMKNIELFFSEDNRIIGYISTIQHMDIAPIYNTGISIMIIHNPETNKITVCTKNTKLNSLLSQVKELENGWGGPENMTMLCSPKDGTILDPLIIKEIVRRGY